MNVPAVRIENLTVQISSTTILEDVSLTVNPGEFWGIIGPNGGGKTTLLRCIIGVVKPSKGKIEVFGMEPARAVKRGLVGYLPQHLRGRVPFTPLDIIELVGKPERAKEMLKLVGLEHKATVPFGKLSGGERQRVLIAAVLSRDPKLLLLDEPNTAIDVVAQDTFYNLLKSLKKRGITILMVSHDVGVISRFVDKIACLNRRLKFSGDPTAALDCNLLEEIYGREVDVFIHHPGCAGCHIYRRS